jgi:hypothetical protein
MSSAQRRKVEGVGINDADYPVTQYQVVNGKQKRVWMCPLYSRWKSMLERCYNTRYQRTRSTYTGCSVVPEWLLFSNFRQWALLEDWQGKELDKDLLIPGNKVYGPTACCFITADVNVFIAVTRRSSTLPPGVSPWCGRYRAQCGTDGYLGMYPTPEMAYAAWRRRKHVLANALADCVADPRIAHALRIRYV